MSSSDSSNNDENPPKLNDDDKSLFCDPSLWPSWITHSQSSLASPRPEVPVDSEATIVSSLAYDVPTPLSASNYSSVAMLSDDNLCVGSLVLSDNCLNQAPNSDDSKHEKAQAYSLINSVNTSDDIKSSGSPMPMRGSSVHKTSGAVSKKHPSGTHTGRGSWGSAMEKGIEIIAKGSSCHRENGVSDDEVSPSLPAPPPPPPTPNVLTSDSSQEHSFLAGVSPSKVPFSTARRSGGLATWQPPSQLPSSSEKRSSDTCAITNSTSSHHKEAAHSYNLLNYFSGAKTESNDFDDSNYLVLDSPTQHSVYGVSTNHSLYEDTGEANSSSMSKTIPIERCAALNSRAINSSPNSTLTSEHSPDAPGVCGLAEASVSTSNHGDVGACYMGHSPSSPPCSSRMSSSKEVCSSRVLPPSSMCGSTHSSMVHLTVSGSGSSSNDSVPLASAGAGSSVVAVCSSACSCGRLPAVRVCSSSSSAQGLSSSGSVRINSNDRQSNAPPLASNEAEPALHHRQIVHNAKAGPMYNWQATLTTVKERFAFLFNNEILSDVQFVVGRGEDEQNIPAHKFVLAVGSAVFDAMFNGQLASQQQLIRLPDVEPQAFLALLSFLYSDEVQIGPETVMTVLYTAKKYAVPALERRCVDFLKTNLSSDNAFMLLTQARLFDEPQLAALCLKTIDKCTAEAIVAEGFTDIDHDTLSLVLQRDTLRIKELHLFQAVCRWAEAECVRQGSGSGGRLQRSVLGQALKLIRFPLMTVEEFAQGPAQSNILTDAEVVQLFLYFSVNPKPSVDFIDVPRCCMTGKEQTMCRFQSTEARWGYSGTPDRIRFIVDRRIFVVGFGMYGSIHGPSEYEVTVQLIHTLTGKVCGSNETVFTSDGTCNTFRVMFPDPIEVLPNTNYTAYATLKGPDSHYGTKGLRKVVVECPSGDRVCFQFSYAAGNNNGTSVEDGQIPEIIFYT